MRLGGRKHCFVIFYSLAVLQFSADEGGGGMGQEVLFRAS